MFTADILKIWSHIVDKISVFYTLTIVDRFWGLSDNSFKWSTNALASILFSFETVFYQNNTWISVLDVNGSFVLQRII